MTKAQKVFDKCLETNDNATESNKTQDPSRRTTRKQSKRIKAELSRVEWDVTSFATKTASLGSLESCQRLCQLRFPAEGSLFKSIGEVKLDRIMALFFLFVPKYSVAGIEDRTQIRMSIRNQAIPVVSNAA